MCSEPDTSAAACRSRRRRAGRRCGRRVGAVLLPASVHRSSRPSRLGLGDPRWCGRRCVSRGLGRVMIALPYCVLRLHDTATASVRRSSSESPGRSRCTCAADGLRLPPTRQGRFKPCLRRPAPLLLFLGLMSPRLEQHRHRRQHHQRAAEEGAAGEVTRSTRQHGGKA